MIKQIQLRGISRTPSDKMSEDGGLSESLNMYMDSAENAPAFVPEDKTAELGLPEGLYAERIFIHKTANYENYIVVQSDKVVAYTPGIEDEEPLLVMELAEEEKVNDITSVGNTLIVSTNLNLNYVLYKERKYCFLGNNIPFPTIEFWDSRSTIQQTIKKATVFDENYSYEPVYDTNSVLQSLIDDETGARVITPILLNTAYDETKKLGVFDKEVWNELSEDGTNSSPEARLIVSKIKEVKDEMVEENRTKGYFSYPIWILYAIHLFDGSLIVSTPQMLSPGQEEPFDIKGAGTEGGYSTFFLRLNHYYKIGAKLYDFNDQLINKWKDIIKGVDVYISEDINRLDFNNITIDQNEQFESGTGDGVNTWIYWAYGKFKISGYEKSFIRHALSCSNFVKIEEFFIDESFYNENAHDIAVLREDYIFDSIKYIKNSDRFSGRTLLSDQEYKTNEYKVLGNHLTTYNNRMFILNASKEYLAGPSFLCGQRYNTVIPLVYINKPEIPLPDWFWVNDLFDPNHYTYSFAYILDNAVVHGNSNGANKFEVINRYNDLTPYVHSLIIYPSKDCKSVEYVGNENKHVVPMLIHPNFPNMTYYYANQSINDNPIVQNSALPDENKKVISNNLYVSEVNNPLFIGETFTFQSKVLGVAVATTALSQGQFGQFPLYVFTEDGIWAMETAADGSFVSQKPLSREVCINPDSITSIDNAVVFVTAKAVMMIQGSQVMNISPYMNGRHYTPNESALNIIVKQDGYDTFVDVISDEDPFMTFMKDAKVAYDYTGQRLIFISPANKGFQYVYKIDTQTWHKVAFEGLNLDTPLNSFPECLVMTEPKISQETKTLLRFSSSDMTQKAAVIKAFDERLGDLVGLKDAKDFIDGTGTLDKNVVGDITSILDELSQEYSFTYTITEEEKVLTTGDTKIVSLSTILDDSIIQETAKGILITRPFDLGMPDVYKSITDIRVRGYYAKGAVKFILQGSDDGRTFYTLSSLRGKSWKMFRIFILANLDPTERISWIDINFEPRYNTKLR